LLTAGHANTAEFALLGPSLSEPRDYAILVNSFKLLISLAAFFGQFECWLGGIGNWVEIQSIWPTVRIPVSPPSSQHRSFSAGSAGRIFSLFSRIVTGGLFTSTPERARDRLSLGPISPNLSTSGVWVNSFMPLILRIFVRIDFRNVGTGRSV
jgi:hypothetical protein